MDAQTKTKRNLRSPESRKPRIREVRRPAAGWIRTEFSLQRSRAWAERGIHLPPHLSVTPKKPLNSKKDNLPELGRSPGEGNGNPPRYSCERNPTDRGAWQATVHGVGRVGHGLRLNHHHHPPRQKWSRQKRPLCGYPDKGGRLLPGPEALPSGPDPAAGNPQPHPRPHRACAPAAAEAVGGAPRGPAPQRGISAAGLHLFAH